MRIAVERAIDELRRGRPVTIAGDTMLSVIAIELTDAATLAAFETDRRADLLLTDKRAAQLAIANQRPAAGMQAVRAARPDWIDAETAIAVADPGFDLSAPLKGPFRALDVADERTARAALTLAKLAGLLPALHIRDWADRAEFPVAPVAEIERHRHPDTLVEVSRARLPLKAAEKTQAVMFRSPGGPEHLALLIGDIGETPLVRLHSSCLTGDVLGSLKCDCGDQLQAAIAAIAADGGGIVLYLQQEGRGIGLAAKLRAYRLQDQGFDTVDANLRLGFEIDERDYGLAAAMLRTLGIANIRLLTNNPSKLSGLTSEGISIAERVPLVAGHGEHNAAYLATKRDRTGHQY
ncbi:MAG: GTP cyclohydrolase II [Pseudomonadota bacterium]